MTRHDARAIVKTIIELARTLGMDTIAEGVEEPAQLDVLRQAGCDAVQGFMVARPMPRGDFLRLLADWSKPATTPGELPGCAEAVLGVHRRRSRRISETPGSTRRHRPPPSRRRAAWPERWH